MENIKLIFNEVLGAPVNDEKLTEYIAFCKEYSGKFTEYKEVHHILPRSKFNEYKTDKWNLVELSYENHVLAHFKLIEAYPIKSFCRPLNFLKNKTDEQVLAYKTAISIATVKWWENFKKDKVKYNEYIKSKQDWYNSNNYEGSDFHKKVCLGVQKFYENNPERKEELSIFFSELWNNLTDEEYKIRCENMKWDSNRHKKHLEHLKLRYSNEEFMEGFTKKMTEVNSNIDKRTRASKTITKNWESEEFREKVLQARKEKDLERKMSGKKRGNSAKMKELWANPLWREKMLEKRKESRTNETK